jgi:hypothetical protein
MDTTDISSAATESPAVETFSEGRQSTQDPVSNCANGHADDTPKSSMSLAEYKDGLKTKREEAEARATAQAEVSKLSESERLALSRKTSNPLYREHDLAQDLDAAEVARLGLQDAKAPPSDAEEEIAELEARYDTLSPEAKGSALGRIAELKRQASETKRAEIKKSLEEMRMRHELDAAQMQAHSNRAALIAEDLQSQLQQNFPEVVDQQSLWHLSQTDPERYAAYLAHHGHAQMIMAGIAQQQQQAEHVQGFHESQWVSAQDYQVVSQIARDRPHLLENGRLKPEVTRSIVRYAEAIGVNQHELKSWYQQPANRDHRIQLMLLDAAEHHSARAKAKEAKKAPLPKVQRPGEPTGSRSTHLDDRIAALESKGDRSGLSLREASKLNAMKIRRERG